jgi:hypothetical protein
MRKTVKREFESHPLRHFGTRKRLKQAIFLTF